MQRIYFLPRLLAVAVTFAFWTHEASGQLYINELFFDPGGAGQDARDEYIELRGAPGMSLANHYLIFVENEDDELHAGQAGLIENYFDLANFSIGSNGYLLFRQDATRYANDLVAPGTTDFVHADNDDMLNGGWGNGPTSLVGHTGELGKITLENGGWTAMLIRSDGMLTPRVSTAETPGLDLDIGNDGLDPEDTDEMDWRSHWTILDAIGYIEDDEAYDGRLYGMVNFGVDIPGEPIFEGGPLMHNGNVEPGAVYVGLGFEIEMLARWGNSTGQTPADWHATNLTENPNSGSAGVMSGPPPVADFRQSGDPHPVSDEDPTTPPMQPALVETSRGVPYGKKLVSSLGAPNYLTGDYNGDGEVDSADYVVWRHTMNQMGSELNLLAADANHDFLVNSADYAAWQANYGAPNNREAVSSTFTGSTAVVPEPAGILLVSVALLFCANARVRPR